MVNITIILSFERKKIFYQFTILSFSIIKIRIVHFLIKEKQLIIYSMENNSFKLYIGASLKAITLNLLTIIL